MDRAAAYPLPSHDPVTGGALVITEVEGVDSGITLRGRFEVPRFARLSPEQARYLETFLKCRGMLNSVERELGISYPTARARLDAVLKALDLHPAREESPSVGGGEPESIETAFDGATLEDTLEEPGFEEFEPVPETTEVDEPEVEAPAAEETPVHTRLEVLEMLERGEITPDRAKEFMGVAK